MPTITSFLSSPTAAEVGPPTEREEYIFFRNPKLDEERDTLDEYTNPSSYVDVLDTYPNVRLCLAHFGGDEEWKKYKRDVDRGTATISSILNLNYFRTEEFKKLKWVRQIVEMLQSGVFF